MGHNPDLIASTRGQQGMRLRNSPVRPWSTSLIPAALSIIVQLGPSVEDKTMSWRRRAHPRSRVDPTVCPEPPAHRSTLRTAAE